MAGTAIQVTSTIPFVDLPGRHLMAYRTMIEGERAMMADEGPRLAAIARSEAPSRTGEFAQGIDSETFTTGTGAGFRLMIPQPLGNWIIEGTPAHVIAAKNGRVLAFEWAGGAHGPGMYFFPRVSHPGTRPNPFTRRAYETWQPGARNRMHLVATLYVTSLKNG